MKEPKSVTVRLKSPTPQALAADLLTPPDYRPSPAVVCHISADSVLFVSGLTIDLGTRVPIALPADRP